MEYEENKQLEALFLSKITVLIVSSGTKGLIMACCLSMNILDTASFSMNAIMRSRAVLKKQLPEGMCAWEHSFL